MDRRVSDRGQHDLRSYPAILLFTNFNIITKLWWSDNYIESTGGYEEVFVGFGKQDNRTGIELSKLSGGRPISSFRHDMPLRIQK